MLVKIKPHSTLSNYFSSMDLSVDLHSYMDLMHYLNSMQSKFISYLKLQRVNQLEESIVFLDKNLKIINPDEFYIRKAKAGDVIYIVPAIVGGGGKRGGILAVLAVAMFAFIAIPAALAGAAAAGAASPIGATVAGASIFGGGGFLSNLAVNVGLALMSAIFSPKPTQAESTRDNDMFGSLANSTNSGTPIALHYGLVRVAGQYVSGYIKTIDHGKSDVITVSSITTI